MRLRLKPLITLLYNPSRAMAEIAAAASYVFGAILALLATFLYRDILSRGDFHSDRAAVRALVVAHRHARTGVRLVSTASHPPRLVAVVDHRVLDVLLLPFCIGPKPRIVLVQHVKPTASSHAVLAMSS